MNSNVSFSANEARMLEALLVITTYFNWEHFRNKRSNYDIFISYMKQAGIRVLTVECALAHDSFELNPSKEVIQVRTSSIMWQKERLLNVALNALPYGCRFVAWIDCDVIFQNSRWHLEAIRQMANVRVLQLFADVVRLKRLATPTTFDKTLTREGFVSSLSGDCTWGTASYPVHPGFAWAIHRDAIEACQGFFDVCVVGGADRVMAHAWSGDFAARPVRRITAGALRPHYLKWAERAFEVVGGSVSHIPGTLFHMWHGDHKNRAYMERHKVLAALGFDPRQDLCRNEHGCWEWTSRTPELERWMALYFAGRKEDG